MCVCVFWLLPHSLVHWIVFIPPTAVVIFWRSLLHITLTSCHLTTQFDSAKITAVGRGLTNPCFEQVSNPVQPHTTLVWIFVTSLNFYVHAFQFLPNKCKWMSHVHMMREQATCAHRCNAVATAGFNSSCLISLCDILLLTGNLCFRGSDLFFL